MSGKDVIIGVPPPPVYNVSPQVLVSQTKKQLKS